MAATGGFITKIVGTFRSGNIIVRLIYINVVVFLLVSLTEVVLTLFNVSCGGWKDWLALPASLEAFVCRPWSLLTYMFMHADVLHILFNMLWLYWFGQLALNFFSSKHLRGLYLLGGIMGALLYLLAYQIFPSFQAQREFAHLVGASASVLAIVVASAVREPDYPIRFLFLGMVRLKYVALFVVVLDLLFMTSANGGGHIAHLGGALAGWWFAIGLNKGYDVTRWLNACVDALSFQGHHRSGHGVKMKVHFGNGNRQDDARSTREQVSEEEVNRILDKLRKSGYGSLTSDEKRSLFDVSKK